MSQIVRDKVAVVTGGASGIGKETVKLLAREGASVVVADMNLDAAKSVARSVDAEARRSLAIKSDVTSSEDMQSLIRETVLRFGRLDIMVNNAGTNSYTTIEEMTKAEWDKMMDLHAWGVFLGCKFAAEPMRKQKSGRIVNLSSLNAKAGGIFSGVNYTAAKAAILGITKSFAKLLAPHAITVNAVCPGPIDTPFHDRTTPEQKATLQRAIPLGRWGKPEEIATAVLFLSSDWASFITGVSLDVNGGLYMD